MVELNEKVKEPEQKIVRDTHPDELADDDAKDEVVKTDDIVLDEALAPPEGAL